MTWYPAASAVFLKKGMSACRYLNAVCCLSMKAILCVLPGVQAPAAAAAEADTPIAAARTSGTNTARHPRLLQFITSSLVEIYVIDNLKFCASQTWQFRHLNVKITRYVS